MTTLKFDEELFRKNIIDTYDNSWALNTYQHFHSDI